MDKPNIEYEIVDHPLRYYGYNSQLKNWRGRMMDDSLPYSERAKAERRLKGILKNLEDKKLMNMRSQLIRAGQAGDREFMARISAQMRLYLNEDPESGGEEV